MLNKRVAAAAAVATLALTGLGATVATPAFAASAKCKATVEALETVLVHVANDGGPPDSSNPAPPRNQAQRDKDIVVGQLQKGKKACLAGSPKHGDRYRVAGNCHNEESDVWHPIRF